MKTNKFAADWGIRTENADGRFLHILEPRERYLFLEEPNFSSSEVMARLKGRTYQRRWSDVSVLYTRTDLEIPEGAYKFEILITCDPPVGTGYFGKLIPIKR